MLQKILLCKILIYYKRVNTGRQILAIFYFEEIYTYYH